MHSTKVLLSLAALAGTSLSQKSDKEFCFSYLTSFLSLASELVPPTPTAILDFIATNPQIPTFGTSHLPGATPDLDGFGHQEQLCALATELPSSLLPELKSVVDGLLGFARPHSDQFIGYVTNCAPPDEIAESTSYFNYIFAGTGDLCHDAPLPTHTGGTSLGTTPSPTPTPAPTPAPTMTGASNGTTPTTSSLIPTAAAVRHTGTWLGAAAVGGVLGAAVLL